MIKDWLKLEKQDGILSKCDTTTDALQAVGVDYPYYGDTSLDTSTLDNIVGNNINEFRSKLNMFFKKLENEISTLSKTSPITDGFKYNKQFVGKIHGDIEGVLYYPFSVIFDDGQILVGLARQYGHENSVKTDAVTTKETFKIVKWILNEQDITSAIYGSKTEAKEIILDGNYAKLAKKIALFISKNHTKFIKKNSTPNSKLQKKIRDLNELKDELLKNIEDLKKENENNSGDINTEYKSVEEDIKKKEDENKDIKDNENETDDGKEETKEDENTLKDKDEKEDDQKDDKNSNVSDVLEKILATDDIDEMMPFVEELEKLKSDDASDEVLEAYSKAEDHIMNISGVEA